MPNMYVFADGFTNFQYVLTWHEAFSYSCGLLVFISMVKLLRLLRFNRKVAELSSTLSISVRPLLTFIVPFINIFVAFALFAMTAFGCYIHDYTTFPSTVETLFSMMLKSFKFSDLRETSPVLGPIFFMLYTLILTIVVMSLLVAILNESYHNVKFNHVETETDYKMVDYMIQQLKCVLRITSPFTCDILFILLVY